MNLSDVATGIQLQQVLPLLAPKDEAQAEVQARSLVAAGVGLLEVALRAPHGWRVLEHLDSLRLGATIGVGTVTSEADARRAIELGAKFVVSPGLSIEVLHACRSLDVPAIPGVATATEAMMASRLGCGLLKFFPASHLGGPAGVAALGAALPHLEWLPTGGVTPASMGAYLCVSGVVGVGGSWLTQGLPTEPREAAEAVRVRVARLQDLAHPAKLVARRSLHHG